MGGALGGREEPLVPSQPWLTCCVASCRELSRASGRWSLIPGGRSEGGPGSLQEQVLGQGSRCAQASHRLGSAAGPGGQGLEQGSRKTNLTHGLQTSVGNLRGQGAPNMARATASKHLGTQEVGQEGQVVG